MSEVTIGIVMLALAPFINLVYRVGSVTRKAHYVDFSEVFK